MVTMTQIWFIAAAVLLLAELLVTTFFMLPFAIGSFFAGLVSLISDSQNIQLGTFVVFSIVVDKITFIISLPMVCSKTWNFR